MDGVEEYAEAEEVDEAIIALSGFHPTLVLLDFSDPKSNASALAAELLSADPDLEILIISDHGDALHALAALRAGARGFFVKSQPLAELDHAIRVVGAGEIYIPERLRRSRVFRSLLESDPTCMEQMAALSRREADVFDCLAKGMTTMQASEALQVSVKTIETHRIHLKEKLGFNLAEDLVEFAKEWVAAEGLRHPSHSPVNPPVAA